MLLSVIFRTSYTVFDLPDCSNECFLPSLYPDLEKVRMTQWVMLYFVLIFVYLLSSVTILQPILLNLYNLSWQLDSRLSMTLNLNSEKKTKWTKSLAINMFMTYMEHIQVNCDYYLGNRDFIVLMKCVCQVSPCWSKSLTVATPGGIKFDKEQSFPNTVRELFICKYNNSGFWLWWLLLAVVFFHRFHSFLYGENCGKQTTLHFLCLLTICSAAVSFIQSNICFHTLTHWSH